MIKTPVLFAMLFGAATMFGCAVDTGEVDETQEIIANLVEAGFPRSEITVVEGMVYVGGDAHVNLAASREMLVSTPGQEHYRSSNIVSYTRNRICINPTSAFFGQTRLVQGLDRAIENFNALSLSFKFERGPIFIGCDSTITITTTTGNGGSSGFPSGGHPYGLVYIGTGVQSFSDDVIEHVITHELGHCVGLRHTDYYNRAISCGSGGNEGSANVGVIHIPGTPTTATVGGSIMNACFRSTETGEFTSADRTALETLY
ncbi:MAG: M57 family metalloprotease [Polyangiales bacterium]